MLGFLHSPFPHAVGRDSSNVTPASSSFIGWDPQEAAQELRGSNGRVGADTKLLWPGVFQEDGTKGGVGPLQNCLGHVREDSRQLGLAVRREEQLAGTYRPNPSLVGYCSNAPALWLWGQPGPCLAGLQLTSRVS